MQTKIWCELSYPCKNCRRISRKKLKKRFPIKTSPKTIWVFADPTTLTGKLENLGIDVESMHKEHKR